VLSHAEPETIAGGGQGGPGAAGASGVSSTSGAGAGKRSQARYSLDAAAAGQARARVADLLGRHPVYPELDLGLMLEAPWLQAAARPAAAGPG
jgi:hypothetical protein